MQEEYVQLTKDEANALLDCLRFILLDKYQLDENFKDALRSVISKLENIV